VRSTVIVPGNPPQGLKKELTRLPVGQSSLLNLYLMKLLPKRMMVQKYCHFQRQTLIAALKMFKYARISFGS
jgi:hypothetical protein